MATLVAPNQMRKSLLCRSERIKSSQKSPCTERSLKRRLCRKPRLCPSATQNDSGKDKAPGETSKLDGSLKKLLKTQQDAINRAKEERDNFYDMWGTKEDNPFMPGWLHSFGLWLAKGMDDAIQALEKQAQVIHEEADVTLEQPLRSTVDLTEHSLDDVPISLIVPTSLIMATLFTSWLVVTVGYYIFGVSASRQLHVPDDWITSIPQWLKWTAPYVGGTIALGYFRPELLNNRGMLRSASLQDDMLRELNIGGIVSLGAALGYSCSLIYQGLWFQVFWAATAGRDTLVGDDLLSATNSMMIAPTSSIPALLALPTAILLTGMFEGAAFYCNSKVKDLSTELSLEEMAENGTDMQLKKSYELLRKENVVEQLSEEDLVLTAIRIGTSGTWLAAETAITGSLVFTVCTSALGIATALFVARENAVNDLK